MAGRKGTDMTGDAKRSVRDGFDPEGDRDAPATVPGAHLASLGGRTSSLLGWMLAGFVLWFAALCVLYAYHAVACDLGHAPRSIILALAALLTVAMAGCGLLILIDPWRRSEVAFGRRVAGACLIAAALATLATMAPALWLAPCSA